MMGPYGAARDTMAVPPAELERNGLFDAALFPDADDARWLHGVQWEPVRGGSGRLRPAECVDLQANTQVSTEPGMPLVGALPFLTVAEYRCKATSHPIEDAFRLALQHLAQGEQRAVERAVSAGEVGNEPTFLSAVDVTPAGSLPGLLAAVGILEAALSDASGLAGVLHAPRRWAATIRKGTRPERPAKDGPARTIAGNLWSFGGGYQNTPPTGKASSGPGEFWMFATPRPFILRGDPWVQPFGQPVSKDTNDLVLLAQRDYMVGWSYEAFAVHVDVGA